MIILKNFSIHYRPQTQKHIAFDKKVISSLHIDLIIEIE